MTDEDAGRAPTCSVCGTRRADGSALGWGTERDPAGGVRWTCPPCARRHVRDVEAKLAPEWWSA